MHPPFHRFNKSGMRFDFLPTKDGKTLAIYKDKQMKLDMSPEKVSQCYYNWQMKGEYIQVAFAGLPPEQREFLITGMSLEEWNEIFKNNDDNYIYNLIY